MDLTHLLLEEPLSAISQVDPRLLQPHPRNASIYGEEDVTELVELMRQSKWVKPLVVTPSLTIISGHRRWKAVLELEWSAVPVEVKNFATQEEELEALLLENASRFKTTEQKVREAQAWKSLEQAKARERMSEGGKISAPGKSAELKGVENFPHLSSKGKTRDRLAKLVGLGSGRTYAKAAKVVETIDRETSLGNLETAQTLRRVLNSKSVDAAMKLLKHPTKASTETSEDNSDGCNQSETTPSNRTFSQPSCWNCQHRGEFIGNDSFYCTYLGILSLLEQDADTRGSQCERWSQIPDKTAQVEQAKNYTLTLSFPPHLRPLLEDAARDAGMSVVDWAQHQLTIAAHSAEQTNQPDIFQPTPFS